MGQLRVSLIAVMSLLSLAAPFSLLKAQAATAAAFVFTPPSTSPPFPDTVVGILRPSASGSLVTGLSAPRAGHFSTPLAAMLRATDVDLGKIIVSKGLRIEGTNLSRTKLAAARRANLVLLLDPQLRLDLTLTRPNAAADRVDAIVTGHISLVFREPESGATVSLKQIHLADFARTERAPTSSHGLDAAATNDLLHAFYPVMMQQIWAQLDPTDFRVLAIKMVPD